MKTMITIFSGILFFIASCSSIPTESTQTEKYKCIESFLAIEGVNINESDILIEEKKSTIETLRIFNRGLGIISGQHDKDFNKASKLYEEKNWKKLYEKHKNDTIKKYWKNIDFVNNNFILENENDGYFEGFGDKYPDSKKIICLSDPLYYMNDKYVMFFYEKSYSGYYRVNSGVVIIMKKEKGKWIVAEIVGDYLSDTM